MHTNQIHELSYRFDLPQKVICHLLELGAIGNPLTVNDAAFLHTYGKIWSNQYLLKYQLAKYSIQKRQEIIDNPLLTEQWEIWLYGEYFYCEVPRFRSSVCETATSRIILKPTHAVA